jgi:2-iminobutanoate/2-iminopropanoate deaminase
MLKKVVPVTGVFPYEPLGFTNCVRVGDMLYLSGIAGVDAQGKIVAYDVEAQTVQTFKNIERILQAAGSSLDQIVQMTSFVVHLERNGFPYVEARRKILTKPDYTSATIGVSNLLTPGAVLEIQCRACVPRGQA